MRFIVYPFIRLFMRVEYSGKENIPKNGGYLICANHTGTAKRAANKIGVRNVSRMNDFLYTRVVYSLAIMRLIFDMANVKWKLSFELLS